MDDGRTTQTRLFPTGRGQSDTHATILHDGKPNRTPQAGMPYETIDYVGVVRLMMNPPRAPKTKAQWLIPSTYREHDARDARGAARSTASFTGSPSTSTAATRRWPTCSRRCRRW